MSKNIALRPYPEEAAERLEERLEKIFGTYSAAGRALKELYIRRSQGEDVALFTSGNCIVVGPRQNLVRIA